MPNNGNFFDLIINRCQMSEVRIYKTSEKILVWMKRNNYTQDFVSSHLSITRQTLAKRLQDNFFSVGELITLRRLGFDD